MPRSRTISVSVTAQEDEHRGSWRSDIVCAAITFGFIFGVIIALPVIAPNGLAELGRLAAVTHKTTIHWAAP